jgi:hypothetical protein
MDGIKSIFASKTFWGAIIAVGAGVAGIFHYTVAAEDQAQLVDIIAGVGAGVGGLIAIWGRVTASKQIGSSSSK